MHDIYAIEPEGLCNSWERFDRIFIEGMGYGQGRLMAVFPRLKDWMREAKRNPALNQMGQVKAKSIKEKYLRRNGEEFRKRTTAINFPNDCNGANWLEKAEEMHSRVPFKAVLAEENPRSNTAVVRFDDINGECIPWSVRSSGRIPRNLESLCGCTEHLLKQCRKVAFVDPHFCFETRFLTVLKKNLEHLRDSEQIIESIEFNCSYNPQEWSKGREDTFLYNFEHSMRNESHRFMPAGSKEIASVMSFKIWRNTQRASVHPRLILTDIAGLNIESGLDAAREPESMTPVSRISGVELLEWWAEYTEPSSPFDLIKTIPVAKGDNF
ncbi:hypothetical protein QEH59_11830 [Coraliomargarita sp. SDUM461004]|uniref:Uncharacterized protein n=1 Tax=Thalassobacterium sedimentorum TaxID=3041258 RepID=A0ABU1AK39_9BACT|nr:hypothetical protein [Coraliomargarita sp. SDUM461004]MDQ8195119.1 hypothetical protein [Coraliomargarita sp. SDUM461004]